jgi:hypothetical protein
LAAALPAVPNLGLRDRQRLNGLVGFDKDEMRILGKLVGVKLRRAQPGLRMDFSTAHAWTMWLAAQRATVQQANYQIEEKGRILAVQGTDDDLFDLLILYKSSKEARVAVVIDEADQMRFEENVAALIPNKLERDKRIKYFPSKGAVVASAADSTGRYLDVFALQKALLRANLANQSDWVIALANGVTPLLPSEGKGTWLFDQVEFVVGFFNYNGVLMPLKYGQLEKFEELTKGMLEMIDEYA